MVFHYLIFYWYMLEEGGLDPIGKLFYAKLEEGNGGLGYRKNLNAERASRSPRDEEAREVGFY